MRENKGTMKKWICNYNKNEERGKGGIKNYKKEIYLKKGGGGRKAR